MSESDDSLIFIDEDEASGTVGQPPWKIAVIDDDEQVHAATRYALDGYRYDGRPLELLSAYSAEEGEALFRREPDIACALLDVVMGSEDAGLRLVRWVRDSLQNLDVQIILRTGQPGYAPELEVITRYGINDYKTKSELTRTKLLAAVTTALRGYHHLRTVQASRLGLEMIIEASRDLFQRRSVGLLSAGVLKQICALLRVDEDGVVCFLQEAQGVDDVVLVPAAAGRYRRFLGQRVRLAELAVLDPTLEVRVRTALGEGRSQFFDDGAVLAFGLADGRRTLAAVRCGRALSEVDRNLLEVFAVNSAVCFDNVHLLERVRRMAFYDSLTGLYSPARFAELVDERLRSGPVAVVICDLVHFHTINERLGHPVGDAVLQEASRRIAAQVGPSSIPARLGGNSFGFVWPRTPPAVLEQAVRRLRAAVALPLEIAGCRLDIGVTTGAALGPEHGGSAKELIDHATVTLKRQKAAGRGGFSVYDPEIGRGVASRLGLVHELSAALESGAFVVHYQPKVEAATGRIVGAEALLRWRREDGTLVRPGDFIPAVEDSGLILPVGDFVLQHAGRWRARSGGLPDAFRVAVNVSARQVLAPDFVQRVLSNIAAGGCRPDQIELEITESVLVDERERVIASLDALRAEGISVALDDFGTGFSSLAYLVDLPLDVLKIDRRFVQTLGTSSRSDGLFDAVVGLSRSLGLTPVAEGVETVDQCRRVRDAGCAVVQGFLFSPAVEGAVAADTARLEAGWRDRVPALAAVAQ